jgi:hypothetical protein
VSASAETPLSYAELVARSAALPYAQPTEANRIASLARLGGEVEEHAAGVRPILHGRVPALLSEFLALKRELGSPAEQALYEGMGVVDLVSRLLAQRPLAFLGAGDSYLLRDGTRGSGGFDAIGTPEERSPLLLDDLLSYDEMALSALLGVSVPTHFINAGSRGNRAAPGAPGSFEPRGIYVGLVGARFERPERMEWRHMLVTPEQNTAGKGYGADADPARPETRLLRAWARFYGLETLPLFAEAEADRSGRFLRLGEGAYLDGGVYRERLRISVEAFLLEANGRAGDAGTRAYAHAVGLGLGVWAIDPRQTEIMVEVYAEVLRRHSLPYLADLDFSWFAGARRCGGAGDGELFSEEGNAVRIHFSRRDPAAPLSGADAGKLLVATYAWDSNAFPGNEYWLGSLSASGDPAAACCSTLPELQNPDVNPRVSGAHAMLWTGPAAPATLSAWGKSH